MKNTYKVNEEAVKKIAERVYDNGSTVINRNDLEEMFPELAESEDERIRIKLLNYLYDVHDDDEERARWIAYLEKQGEQKPNYCHHEVDLSNCSEEYTKGYYDGWNNCNQQHAQLEAEQKPADVRTTGYWNVQDIEQKPTDTVEPKFKIGDYVKNVNDKREPIYEIVYMDKECYICEYRGKENIGDKAVMHFAFDYPYLRLVQKPDNKIEPKFKVSDWVVYDGWTCQITDVKEDGYCNDHNGFIPKDREDDMHLWTIQDAKDGDVLHCWIDGYEFILIFNCIKDGYVNAFCHLYNNLDSFAEEPTTMFCRTIQGHFTPATKEQRDLLFQKMKEAGYEWDAEKKELKMIGQKPTWSEEDECTLSGILSDYSSMCATYKDWLKSLKEKVYFQTTWKPSDEQIDELRKYSDNVILRNLYYNLKKLKE